ncbi:MAG: hypothetical protein ACJ74Y_11185, partial [Bryobacteraceae bacterium]
ETLEVRVQTNIRETIESFSGSQFNELIGIRIPASVRKELKYWVDSHSTVLRQLITAIERNLCVALSRSYRTAVNIRTQPGSAGFQMNTVTLPEVTAEDLSFTNVKAGLLTGGAAALLLLIGMGPLVPFVGMAGLPLISRLWHQKELQEAKTKALIEIESAVSVCMSDFSRRVLAAIDEDIASLTSSINERFLELVEKAGDGVRSEIASRTNARSDMSAQLQVIRSAKQQATAAVEELLAIAESKAREQQVA